jgi:Tfp pilus assembly protein PilO
MEGLMRFRLPLLIGAGALVFVVVVYAAVVSPQSHKLSSLHARQTQLQAQQAQLQAELVTLRRDKADFAGNCAKLGNELSAIPPSPDVSQFLQQVTNLAVATGNANTPTISVLQATGSSSSSASVGATPVQVSLTLEGTYGQMTAFLKGLDSFPRLFTVNQLSVTGGAIAAGGGPLNPATTGYSLNLTGAIYYSTGRQDVCQTPAGA